MHRDYVTDAGDTAHRQAHHLDPGPQTEELQRAYVRGVGVELVSRGVAQEDRQPAQAGWRQPRCAAKPVASPMRSERPRRRIDRLLAADLLERGQQHLLDRLLNRAEPQRRLDRRIRPLAIVFRQRGDQRCAIRGERLARANNCRRDRETVVQRLSQSRHFAMQVTAVVTRGSLWCRKIEPRLPRAQRVRGDVKQRRRFTRLQIAHVSADGWDCSARRSHISGVVAIGAGPSRAPTQPKVAESYPRMRKGRTI